LTENIEAFKQPLTTDVLEDIKQVLQRFPSPF
jgi:hypothetical protein